ncbi:N-formylglutamate amidohydrolase [Asticcacaulis benevestitus]|uniref:N-formylglutamate amidohydrolase n=1 Tax=Asticcacaulis benevestitus DSM 16100 = ATCC BAA-896 TaxID=1121022 RepID=V4RBP4_9CAUL|nr:N-formylglutamate amidohydrolase [Asticcacaulis benevestitus]ESQ88848.1 hypothetical protein ABENE_15170 [Asticcacaulis benevestitus DSM 16100 = ATCC BAA-896]
MISWPSAAETLNETGTSDIVLVCEHASNHIPEAYANLGLRASDVARHIGWDIGAANVTRRLSALLDAPAYLATCSRLLIDLNRPLDAPSSIVTRSEDTDIPGNKYLAEAEIVRRREHLFMPFHQTISDHLDARQRQNRPTRFVSIHSFTPVFLGTPRTWQGGVLFDQAQAFGRDLVARLAASGLKVGANVPYQSDRAEDYGVPIHGDDRGIPAVLIEIRNDLIDHDDGAALWAKHLADALRA